MQGVRQGHLQKARCTGDHADPNEGIYIGETSRTLGERFREHQTKYDAGDYEKSVFSDHMRERHDGYKFMLRVEVISAHPGDAMLRQVTEATLIRELKPGLNRKDEFGNSNVPRERRSDANGGSRC